MQILGLHADGKCSSGNPSIGGYNNPADPTVLGATIYNRHRKILTHLGNTYYVLTIGRKCSDWSDTTWGTFCSSVVKFRYSVLSRKVRNIITTLGTYVYYFLYITFLTQAGTNCFREKRIFVNYSLKRDTNQKVSSFNTMFSTFVWLG